MSTSVTCQILKQVPVLALNQENFYQSMKPSRDVGPFWKLKNLDMTGRTVGVLSDSWELPVGANNGAQQFIPSTWKEFLKIVFRLILTLPNP